MEDDTVVISGFRTILDLEGVTLAHYLQMTPAVMKKMAVLSQVHKIVYFRFDKILYGLLSYYTLLSIFLQDASPMRMKGTHYINTPTGFESVFNVIKNLLNEKNRQRVIINNILL